MISERTEDGVTLIQFLVRVVKGREPRARVADRIEAAKVLMDRLWGKPVTAVELSGRDGSPLQVDGAGSGLAALSVDELRQMIQQRERLLRLMEAQQVAAHDENAPAIAGGTAVKSQER